MFNLKQTLSKHSLRGHDPPQAFLPQKNPYLPHNNQEDGFNLTSPGSSGFPGQSPDLMSPVFNNGRQLPKGISQYGDDADNTYVSDRSPANIGGGDSDPDHPMKEEGPENSYRADEYGTGTVNDYGVRFFDDSSPLSVKQTTMRQLSVNRDKKPFNMMRQRRRVNNPFDIVKRI